MSVKVKSKNVDTRLEGLDWDALQKLVKTDKLYGYREFCRILNLKILGSGSSSQLKQLNELSMICEYEKVNSKYRFLRMRSSDEITLYKERSVFTPLIEYCLSEKFLNMKKNNDLHIQNGILFFSMSNLLLWCGMVHENYQFMRQGDNKFDKKLAICIKHGFNLSELSKFLTVSYDNILKPIVRNALKSMDNKKSITIQKGFKVYRYVDNGRKVIKNVLATSSLGQQLEHIIADVYTEFRITNTQELFFMSNEQRQQLYDRCNFLCSSELGYDGFYDCYAIIINEYRTRYNISVLKKELNKRTQRRILDSKFLDDIHTKSRKDFVATMIALDSNVNFRNDLEEYYHYKMS